MGILCSDRRSLSCTTAKKINTAISIQKASETAKWMCVYGRDGHILCATGSGALCATSSSCVQASVCMPITLLRNTHSRFYMALRAHPSAEYAHNPSKHKQCEITRTHTDADAGDHVHTHTCSTRTTWHEPFQAKIMGRKKPYSFPCHFPPLHHCPYNAVLCAVLFIARTLH